MKSCGLLFYTAIIWRSLQVSAEEATPTVNKPSTVKVVHAQEGQDITVECPHEYLASRPKVQPLMILQKVQDMKTLIYAKEDYSTYKTFSLKYGEKFLTVGIANVSKADAGRYTCGVDSGNTFMFEIVVTERNQQLSLLLLIPALLLLLLLTAGGLLALLCYKKRKSNRERGGDIPEVAAPSLHKAVFHTDLQSEDTSKDIWVIYENLPAPADPIYQNLPLNTSDNNPIYSKIDSPKLYKTVC